MQRTQQAHTENCRNRIETELIQNSTVTFFSTSHVFSCTTHQRCFQNCLLRCHVLSIVVKGLFRTWMEGGLRLVCRKTHLCRDTLLPVFIHFTDVDGTVTRTTLLLYISIAITLLIGCLSPLHKQNDYDSSFCRQTRSHNRGAPRSRKLSERQEEKPGGILSGHRTNARKAVGSRKGRSERRKMTRS